MSLAIPGDAVLLPIDLQKSFDDPRWGQRNNPGLEANVAQLLGAWRAAGRPLVHVRHVNPKSNMGFVPGAPGIAFKDEARPQRGEVVVTKAVHSAFIGTELEKLLERPQSRSLVVFGIQTNYCVASTARMAGNLGYQVFVVGDACATFPQKLLSGAVVDAQATHDLALAELHGEFATVVDAQDVLAALRK